MKMIEQTFELLSKAIDSADTHEAKLLIHEIKRLKLNKSQSKILNEHIEKLQKLPVWSHLNSYHEQMTNIRLVAWIMKPLLFLAIASVGFLSFTELVTELLEELIFALIIFSVFKLLSYFPKPVRTIVSVAITVDCIYTTPYQQLITSALAIAMPIGEEIWGCRLPVYLKALPLALVEGFRDLSSWTSSVADDMPLIDLSTEPQKDLLNPRLIAQLANQTIPQILVIPDSNHFDPILQTRIFGVMQALGEHLGVSKTVFAIEGTCNTNKNNTFIKYVYVNSLSSEIEDLIETTGTIKLIYGGAVSCIGSYSFIEPLTEKLKKDFEASLFDALVNLKKYQDLCRKLAQENLCTFMDDDFGFIQEALKTQKNKDSIFTLYNHIRIYTRIVMLKERFKKIVNQEIKKNSFVDLIKLDNKTIKLIEYYNEIMQESIKISQFIEVLSEQKIKEQMTNGDKAIITAIKQAQTEHATKHIVVRIGSSHVASVGEFNFFLEQQRQAGTSVNIIDITDPELPATLQPFNMQG